ncbi:MAG TPA: hypothetical protein VHB48_03895 [Chitinophagaceae bacterium]|nr:hypothetical protein [Chitinophagaceae bacterium]
MKRYFITIILSFLFCAGRCQIAYYDAIKLKQLLSESINEGNYKNISEILVAYIPTGSDTTADKVRLKFLSNPFFNKLPIAQGYLTYQSRNASIPISKGSSILSAVGGVDITNFADGVAKFLVERFKQELTIAFFDNFKKDISDKRYEDLQTLFPQTYKVLMVIDKDIYQFSAYLNTLREAFIKDLTNMYVNLKNVRNLPKYEYYFNTHPVFATVIDNAFYFIDAYMGGEHPGKVIADYDVNLIKLREEDAATQKNLQSAILVLQQISKSFTSYSPDHYWVTADSIEAFFKDPVQRDIYFGLIYQVTDTITFAGKKDSAIKLTTILRALRDSVNTYEQRVKEYIVFAKNFAGKAKEVDEYIEAINNKAKKDVDYNDYYKVYNAGLDLIEGCFSIVNLPYIKNAISDTVKNSIVEKANKLMYVARTAGEIYVDVRTKNYSSAILNTTVIYDTLFNSKEAFDNVAKSVKYIDSIKTANNNALKAAVKNATDKFSFSLKGQSNFEVSPQAINVLDADIAVIPGISDSVKAILDTAVIEAWQSANTNTNTALKEKLLKYGTFAAAVAQAQNSDDVKKAIESIALPAGSATIKKGARFNVAAQAYVGFQAGHLADGVNGFAKINNMGITAPIGIALSTKTNFGGAHSLFFSLVDIGAIVQYRFAEPDASLSDSVKVRIENIFSPGAFYVFGVPKWPISIGAGFQWQPSLTRLATDKATVAESSGVRYNLFIAVDLPLLNLHNTPATKK